MTKQEKAGLQCLWTRCRDCGGLMYIDATLGFGVVCDCPEFSDVPVVSEDYRTHLDSLKEQPNEG